MKLITFEFDGTDRLGWLQEDGCRVLVAGDGQPTTMQQAISGGAAALKRLAQGAATMRSVDLADVTLLPPLGDPSAIFCVGLNYAEHEREARWRVPTTRRFFCAWPATRFHMARR